jgi:hypothetical protein
MLLHNAETEFIMKAQPMETFTFMYAGPNHSFKRGEQKDEKVDYPIPERSHGAVAGSLLEQ